MRITSNVRIAYFFPCLLIELQRIRLFSFFCRGMENFFSNVLRHSHSGKPFDESSKYFFFSVVCLLKKSLFCDRAKKRKLTGHLSRKTLN